MKQQDLVEEISVFLIEGFEILDRLEQRLVELEACPTDTSLVDEIFREVHTLKGNSGFFSLSNIESLSHGAESLFDEIRSGRKPYTTGVANTMLKFVDYVRSVLNSIEAGKNEMGNVETLIEELRSHLK